MTTVREINEPAELASLAHDWHALLADTPGATFFQTPEWLASYWRHFGANQRLRVLVASEGQHTTGILPLVVRTSRRRWGNVRSLTYPLDDWASFFGPIGPHPAATLQAGLLHLRSTQRDWHVIELPWVDVHDSDHASTSAAFETAGMEAIAEPWQTSAVVDLAAHQSWDAYWASRQSRWRNNVRRSEKKLAAKGKIEYIRYRPKPCTHDALAPHNSPAKPGAGQPCPGAVAARAADPRWDLYDACESIARASWQSASKTGTTLVHDQIRAFLRDCHQAAAQAAALDVNLLLVDGQAAAFNYAYHYRGQVFGLRTGYDPAIGDGVGTVLQARMIADSFARGDHTYDLGPGYLDCKRYWLTTARSSYRYTHFPPNVPLARLMRYKRSVELWWRGGRGRLAPAK